MCPSLIQSSSAYSMRDLGDSHGERVNYAPLLASSFPGSCCSWRPLVFGVSPSSQCARALRPTGELGPSGRSQAAGGLPWEEAAFFRGEAVEEGAVLEEWDVLQTSTSFHC